MDLARYALTVPSDTRENSYNQHFSSEFHLCVDKLKDF